MKTRDILTEKRLWRLESMVVEIGIDELKAKIDNQEVFHLLEISDEEDYRKEHIAGAVHVSLKSVRNFAEQNFKKYEQLVVYTEEADSAVSRAAALMLQSAGFSNALVVQGGKEAWRDAGYPLEGEDVAQAPKS